MNKKETLQYSFLFFGGGENIYGFQTDNLIDYQVKFKDTAYLFDGYLSTKLYAYEMGIQVANNPTNQRPPLDSRIPFTIAAIFRDFFSRNNEQVVIYICDSSDSKQAIRHRKFNQWVEAFKGNDFVKIDADITDYEYIVYFTSLILRRDNPNRLIITEAFFSLTDDQQK